MILHLFSEGRHWQDLVNNKEQKWRNCEKYSKVVKMQLVAHALDSIKLQLQSFLSEKGGRTEGGNFVMEEVSWVMGFPLEMLYNTGIGTEEADVGIEPGLRLAE